MNQRIKTAKTFYKDFIKEAKEKRLTEQKAFFNEHRDDFTKTFVNSFAELLDKTIEMQKAGVKESVAFIIISFLRSNIYKQLTPEFCKIDVYDEQGYENTQGCSVYVGCPWIRDSILKFDGDMRNEIKRSSHKIADYVLEAMILGEVSSFAYILRILMQYAVPEIEKLEQWQALNALEVVDVRFGEYHDNTVSVYKYDTRTRNNTVIRDIMKSGKPMHYDSIKNVNLSNEAFDNLDFRFTDFSGSNFEASSFQNTDLIGTAWRNCNLKGTNFANANLTGADFRGADIEGTLFDGAILMDNFW